MLKKYVALRDDPFSRKLEVMLGSFGQQTCADKMKNITETKITDYFVHK